jgi:hypothetical protein
VIDAQGIYILSNKPMKGRLDLSDRTHFRVHAHSNDEGLFISQPVMGRATGLWSIQLTRRINKPNGEFGGVVVISIDPGYFTRFYSELNLGPGGLTALYGTPPVLKFLNASRITSYKVPTLPTRWWTERSVCSTSAKCHSTRS